MSRDYSKDIYNLTSNRYNDAWANIMAIYYLSKLLEELINEVRALNVKSNTVHKVIKNSPIVSSTQAASHGSSPQTTTEPQLSLNIE